MKPERIAFASSLFLLGGLLLNEVIKVRIRLRTMAIRYSILQSLADDEEFVALHFNPFYDNRLLAKDLVSLEAYMETKERSNRTMPRVPLEVVNMGESYVNETDYSAYELTKDNIITILDYFNGDSEVAYVLFVPEPYREDSRYFSYKILPADKKKRETSMRRHAVRQSHFMTTDVSHNDEMQTGEVAVMFSSMTLGTRVLSMDPSPPATSSFSML